MGLFDNALGSILSQASGSGGNPPVAQMLENLIQQHGGLGGLINQLQQGGLAQEAASWIGTGANLPVSGAQITQALGDGHIAQIAQQLGIDPQRAGGLLAQVLPHVIDHFTPTGELPGASHAMNSGLLGAALGALSRL